MRDLRPLLGALVLASAACGPANFPDKGAVAAAHDGWCQALAKAYGGAAWEPLGACKSATPTASAAYLRGMAKCFPARKAGSDKDAGILIAECKDEVMSKLTIDEATVKEAVDARCERAARCEQANVPECIAAAKKVDPFQRATLYGLYNAAAIHTISECLRGSSCGSDENSAQEACYKTPVDKLVWTP
jgi:hypothetical protein